MILLEDFNLDRDETGRDAMKPKVLIVDDDVAVTQQLFWTLCDEFEVMTANNLASAIRRATIYEPEIAILDLHLPPTLDAPDTGLRILDYVKSRLPASKVFVVSSAATVEQQKDCIRRGADGFLSKPLDVEHLLSTMRRTALARRLEAA
jgi:DNA-binding NtrC family response regulator